jgi:hypothetical protein
MQSAFESRKLEIDPVGFILRIFILIDYCIGRIFKSIRIDAIEQTIFFFRKSNSEIRSRLGRIIIIIAGEKKKRKEK